MIKTYNYKGLIWHDIQNPGQGEIESMMKEYNIPKEAGEDLLSPTPKQRVLTYDNCVYIVLHFPALGAIANKDNRQEIDFIIGKEFLITVHYDNVRSLDNFSVSLKNALEDTENKTPEENAGFIFHKLIKHLYHSLLSDVEVIKSALHRAETAIFKGEEKKMVVELSRIHRDILRFKNAILPHKEAIVILNGVFRDFLGEAYEYLIHDMSSEYQRVERRMQNNKDLLEELRLTNDSLLSAKQNEAIKGLTMMAFITFPLTLTATIFAMRAEHMPIVGSVNDFWIIIGIMISIVLACLAFFTYKKWM